MDREKVLKIKQFLNKPVLSKPMWLIYNVVDALQYAFFSTKWFLQGGRRPDDEEIRLVKENVTFIYKSFERQNLARRLARNIQRYYPGVRVIIADDSHAPLNIKNNTAEVIQLPFNSGLSYGLSKALEQVSTPYTIRLDDDQRLTVRTQFGRHLKFLMEHPEADLVGVPQFTTPGCHSPQWVAEFEFFADSMADAPKPLAIPHLTKLDETHIVVGKSSNAYICRTDKLKEVGYDTGVRMMDHRFFFWRAAGNLVSTIDPTSLVFHSHNGYNQKYRVYRSDMDNDRKYIRAIYMAEAYKKFRQNE